jgi:hypothetical protein
MPRWLSDNIVISPIDHALSLIEGRKEERKEGFTRRSIANVIDSILFSSVQRGGRIE